MSTISTIERRLELVEHSIEQLRRELDPRLKSPNWIDRVIGSFKDEPAFDEVIRLGREFRMADRPAEDGES